MRWSCVGHEQQKAYLERLIERAVLPHTLIFAGPDGVGKRMVAEDVASALAPEGYQFDRRTAAPERDEDGMLHDISIDAMRELKQWMTLRPMGAHKTVVIDDADRLGDEASHALLKLLEEPPAYACFILVTSRPGSLLPTITSRGERLDFRELSDDDSDRALRGVPLDEDDRALVRAVAAGRPGVAVRLVREGRLPDVAAAIAGLEKAMKSGHTERLAYAKSVADDEHADDVVSWWFSWVRTRMPERPGMAPVMSALLTLHEAVGVPEFNRRLALDRFFLSW